MVGNMTRDPSILFFNCKITFYAAHISRWNYLLLSLALIKINSIVQCGLLKLFMAVITTLAFLCMSGNYLFIFYLFIRSFQSKIRGIHLSSVRNRSQLKIYKKKLNRMIKNCVLHVLLRLMHLPATCHASPLCALDAFGCRGSFASVNGCGGSLADCREWLTWLDEVKWLLTFRLTGLFRAHFASFHIHSFLLDFSPFILNYYYYYYYY